MKKSVKPVWSPDETAAAARAFQQWDAFFASRGGGTGPAPDAVALAAGAGALADVQARHQAELLRYPNVVAVAEGARMRGGVPTNERCLVVYVQRKLPARRLAAADRLPRQIEGVPIDVVEVGPIEAQPT